MLATTVAMFVAVSFFDGFDLPGNRLNTSIWTTEFGAPSFLGRTQLRDWVNASSTGPFVVTDGTAQLALDPFNPTGFSLYGTHAKTLMSFQPTPTTDYVLTVRMRLNSLRRGIVYGVYFYGCDSGPCASRHDELDIEVLTNYLQAGASPLRVQLNRYAAEPLGAGHGPVVNLPVGFDPLAFHVWRIRWGLSRVTYFVDDIELFSATSFVPQGTMQANIIAWGPASDWPDAYDVSLQPTASDQQQHFVALVDYVSVATRPVISVTFTDDPILARVTRIKAVHITELRAAIDTLRAEVGLGPAAWTDSSLTRKAIKAIHVQELRDNLKPALTAAGRTIPTYTDDPLTQGAKIKKAHIDELRQAVR